MDLLERGITITYLLLIALFKFKIVLVGSFSLYLTALAVAVPTMLYL